MYWGVSQKTKRNKSAPGLSISSAGIDFRRTMAEIVRACGLGAGPTIPAVHTPSTTQYRLRFERRNVVAFSRRCRRRPEQLGIVSPAWWWRAWGPTTLWTPAPGVFDVRPKSLGARSAGGAKFTSDDVLCNGPIRTCNSVAKIANYAEKNTNNRHVPCTTRGQRTR